MTSPKVHLWLKVVSCQRNKHFDSLIVSNGFAKSSFDGCVYKKLITKTVFVLLLLYVDDILIASSHTSEIQKLKIQLGKIFDMKDRGKAKCILGMEISRDRMRDTLPNF